MTVNVGDKAPEFTLYNTSKESVSLQDYHNQNVVILFFPFAFSSVCTAEMCSMQDDIAYYSSLDSEIVGISVDSLYTLGKFKEDQKLDFPLLSDFNKDVSRSYGAFYETFPYNYKGVSKRAAFVIDKSGYIQYAEVLENGTHLPNFEAIKNKLKEIALTKA